MEIDVRNRSLQSSIDCHVEEACRDENLLTTAVAREYIITVKGQVADLTRKLGELSEEVARSSQQASIVESQRDEALV